VNARALGAWSAAGLVLAVATPNPAFRLLIALAGLALVGFRARRDVHRRGLALFLLFAVLGSAAFNFVLAHAGDDVVLSVPGWVPALGGPLTLEALAFGLAAGIGMAAAVLVVAPFSVCLEPHQVVDALPRALQRTGTTLSASLNLVPAMARSYVAIQEAQRMRGWKPSLRSLPEVMVPTVLTAMEDSIQLAEAMEARAYGSGPRTTFEPETWGWRETVVAACAAGAVALFLLLPPPAWFAYPGLTMPRLEPAAVIACLLLLAPVLLWRSRDSTS
jgi:energy-coupling factor transport system permease protein